MNQRLRLKGMATKYVEGYMLPNQTTEAPNMQEIVQALNKLLPPLIRLAEDAFGPQAGDKKLAAVSGAAQAFLTQEGAIVPTEFVEASIEQHIQNGAAKPAEPAPRAPEPAPRRLGVVFKGGTPRQA